METRKQISDAIEVKLEVINNELIHNQLQQSIELIVDAYRNDKKVLFCGNGGSAADAQHLAAELSGRFYFMILSISKNAIFATAVLIATIFLFCFVSISPAIAQVNQRDETGRRQGPWQGMHPNGRVRYTGQFVDNVPIGTFRHFNPDGSARLNLYHELHNDTVKAVFFHRNGRNLATGQFLHQKRTGIWTYYSQTGQKLSENSYLNGRIHGAFLIFFPSGAISERIEYVKGRKEGKWNQYFENGMLRLEANYLNDKLHGPFIAYHSNGTVLVRAEYYENLPHNQKVFFTSTGEKIREQEFNKGALVSQRVFIHIADEPAVPLGPSNDPILEMIRSGIH